MATRSEPFSLEMLTFGHPESSGTLGSVRWTRGGVKIGLGRPWDTKRQNPRELGRFLRKEMTFFWWVTKPGFFGSPGGGSKAQYLGSHPESSGTLAGVAGELRGHSRKAADAGRAYGHSHSAF